MALKISQSLADTLAATVNTEAANATLSIYSGTAPTNADDALSGNTLLAQITGLVNPFDRTNNVLAPDTINETWEDTSIDATGTASFFRLTTASHTLQGTVTATGGGGDLTLDTVSLVSGGSFSVTGGSITVPLG